MVAEACSHPEWRLDYFHGGEPVAGAPFGAMKMTPVCTECGQPVQVGMTETVQILEATVSALPRGECPACHRNVALRKGGLVREHRPEADTTGRVCYGSGTLAVGIAGWPTTLVAPETVGPPSKVTKRSELAATQPSVGPDQVDAIAAVPKAEPGHCSDHPELELVTHKRAGLRWYIHEDPETVCPSRDHDQRDQDRCRWCGETVADPERPTWSRSPRRAYCKPHHRLLAFRARQAAAS